MDSPLANLSLSRRQHIWRVLRWLAGVAVGLLLCAAIARSLLVRRMMLPRLTLTQSGCVTAVSIAPDGKTIFSGSGLDYELLHPQWDTPADVWVWTAAEGKPLRKLSGFYWRSSGVTASPDGQRVMACGEVHQANSSETFSNVVSWDWRTKQKIWSITGDTPLSYSPDGRLVGCANGIHAAATGKLVCQTSKNIDSAGQSEFTPDGSLFGIIDGSNPKPRTLKDPGDEKSIYSTTRLHFWHTDTGKEAKDFPFTRVRAFDIAHDSKWLILTSDADGMTGGTDGSVVRRVDFQTGKVVWTRERRMNGPNADTEAVLNSAVISPNGKYVVLASNNSHLIVLDAQTGRELFRPFIPPGNTIPSWAMPGGLAFSADGKTLVSRCGQRTLVWNADVLD